LARSILNERKRLFSTVKLASIIMLALELLIFGMRQEAAIKRIVMVTIMLSTSILSAVQFKAVANAQVTGGAGVEEAILKLEQAWLAAEKDNKRRTRRVCSRMTRYSPMRMV
jgi:hypothetical protein